MSGRVDGQYRFETSVENSPFTKAAACIPVVGNVVSLVVDLFLDQKIAKSSFDDSPDIPRAIELVELSKEYQKIGVGRSLLSLALVVSAIALGIITSPYVGLILFFGHVFLTLYHIIEIEERNETIDVLRSYQRTLQGR